MFLRKKPSLSIITLREVFLLILNTGFYGSIEIFSGVKYSNMTHISSTGILGLSSTFHTFCLLI